MATLEVEGLFQSRDKNGNPIIVYPITQIENVDGLPEVIKQLESQLSFPSTGGEPGVTKVMQDGSIVTTTASAVTTVTKSYTPEGYRKIMEKTVSKIGSPTVTKITTIKPATRNIRKEIQEEYIYE